MDLERLIETYELDVVCHHCQAVHRRTIAWLRVHSTMDCATCHSSIVLRTSLMNDEMRRIARQLRKLREQLAQMIQRASGFLSR